MGSVINLLPLIPMVDAAPAVSANISVPITEDFSALLTELMTALQVEQPAVQIDEPVAALPPLQVEMPIARLPEPQVETENEPAPEPEPEPCTTIDPGAVYDDRPTLSLEPIELDLPQAVVPELIPAMMPTPAVIAEGTRQPAPQEPEKAKPRPTEFVAVAEPIRLPGPECDGAPKTDCPPARPTLPEQMLEDVKKLEITVKREAVSQLAQLPQQLRHIEPSIEVTQPRPAVITTDPIANLQQRQLPPRIMPIEKIVIAAQVAERRKPEAIEQAVEGRTSANATHFPNPFQAVESAEAPRPAQLVEIPKMPRLQIVRTVSMEVGEADSQVLIRIEERDGGMKLHLGARNETMHRNIESSVASLVQALKQEQIQVSNVEVTRKSPIEKVRRLREAQ